MKQYRVGNGTANMVFKYDAKKEILSNLFSSVNLSNYKFQMLNSEEHLKRLKMDEHFVSPNFKGKSYLIYFMKYHGMNKSFILDRRKLKYNLKDVDLKTCLILEVKIKCDEELYKGTVLDGKLMTINNKGVFILTDCYKLCGNKFDNKKLDEKYNELNSVISLKMDSNPCYNFDIKINKLYNYSDLEDLVKNVIPKSSLPISGIVFYPKYSGTFYVFNESEKANTQVVKTEFKTNTVKSNDESYHIVRDLPSYLKSRVCLDEEFMKDKRQKVYWLRKTDIPDVYYLQNEKESEQIGIALVPNLKISFMLNEKFEDNSILKFNCYYEKLFKKWVPYQIKSDK